MGDAALIADWILSLERGVISTSASDLNALYKKYDQKFPEAARYRETITNTVDFIMFNFSDLRKSHMMKPYALHSLFTALAHNRYGISAIEEQWGVLATGHFAFDSSAAAATLAEMAASHEGKDTEGPHARYVWGCLSTTDRRPRRTARVAAILRGLGATVPDVVDANLA